MEAVAPAVCQRDGGNLDDIADVNRRNPPRSKRAPRLRISLTTSDPTFNSRKIYSLESGCR